MNFIGSEDHKFCEVTYLQSFIRVFVFTKMILHYYYLILNATLVLRAFMYPETMSSVLRF